MSKEKIAELEKKQKDLTEKSKEISKKHESTLQEARDNSKALSEVTTELNSLKTKDVVPERK